LKRVADALTRIARHTQPAYKDEKVAAVLLGPLAEGFGRVISPELKACDFSETVL
jgi:hypothetical protein